MIYKLIEEPILNWFSKIGISETISHGIYYASIVLLFLICSILLLQICKRAFRFVGLRISQKTNNIIDDKLYENSFFTKLSLLLPLIFFDKCIESLFEHYHISFNLLSTLISMLYVIFFYMLTNSVLKTINYAYDKKNRTTGRSINNIIQAINVLVIIICVIVFISLLFNRSTVMILKGFGALSAVLMLVFRDTILGFVGGIQLAFNKIVLIGDWIEMPEYGADGTVTEISLITVKVQNWDKTITTIPTYNLVTNGVKNWREASESKTRRILRSIYIDASTVKFCDDELLQRLEKVEAIKDYLKSREQEIVEHNKKFNIDESIEINGRRQTNIGIFRMYLYHYLKNNKDIDKNSIFLVRQKQANNHGIPIEIYVFTNTSEFVAFENIQSDIFDHIYASIGYFDLRMYQSPSGSDITNK